MHPILVEKGAGKMTTQLRPIVQTGSFLYRYILRLGFLDGTPGLIFHVLQGFWFRFYIDARIWELRHQSDQKQHKR